MKILIYTDRGEDLYESFDYLIRGIREHIDEKKWKAECSHSRILIKSKTDSKELLIVGRCVELTNVRGLKPDCLYTTSSQIEEYMKISGVTFLYSLAMVKAVALNFMKEK